MKKINNKQETHSDERSAMQKVWDYILTVLNLICAVDNLF